MTILGLYGYSDVGKTTIIERICNQEIKKYKIEAKKGITLKVGYAQYFNEHNDLRYFLDAPGHSAFSLETLRNIDRVDLGIYVVDFVNFKNSLNKRDILTHYDTYTSLLNVFEVPYVLVFNKAEEASKKELEEVFNLFKKINNGFLMAMPLCALLPDSIILLKSKIEQVISTLNKKLNLNTSVSFRSIKSFDVNPVGVPLKKITGGVIGGFLLDDALPDKLYYYDDLINSWNYLKVKKAINTKGSNIYTFETNSDPFFFKNDKLKGYLFLNEKNYNSNKTANLLHTEIRINLKRSYKNIIKNEFVNLLINGQYTIGVVKAVKNNNLVINLKKDSIPVLIENKYPVIVIQKSETYNTDRNEILGVGFCKLDEDRI